MNACDARKKQRKRGGKEFKVIQFVVPKRIGNKESERYKMRDKKNTQTRNDKVMRERREEWRIVKQKEKVKLKAPVQDENRESRHTYTVTAAFFVSDSVWQDKVDHFKFVVSFSLLFSCVATASVKRGLR
jgi:hypothetical protein